jgi:DNA-binding cell septation regulator SpoVG
MDNTSLLKIRDEVEKMEKIHQINILKIFKKHNIDITENSNGIFVNMTILGSDILEEINSYISYVNLQQNQLNKIEQDKERYKKEFYKDNKAVAL